MYKIVRIAEGAYQLECINYTANVLEKSYIPEIPVSYLEILKLKKERDSFNKAYLAWSCPRATCKKQS